MKMNARLRNIEDTFDALRDNIRSTTQRLREERENSPSPPAAALQASTSKDEVSLSLPLSATLTASLA